MKLSWFDLYFSFLTSRKDDENLRASVVVVDLQCDIFACFWGFWGSSLECRSFSTCVYNKHWTHWWSCRGCRAVICVGEENIHGSGCVREALTLCCLRTDKLSEPEGEELGLLDARYRCKQTSHSCTDELLSLIHLHLYSSIEEPDQLDFCIFNEGFGFIILQTTTLSCLEKYSHVLPPTHFNNDLKK